MEGAHSKVRAGHRPIHPNICQYPLAVLLRSQLWNLFLAVDNQQGSDRLTGCVTEAKAKFLECGKIGDHSVQKRGTLRMSDHISWVQDPFNYLLRMTPSWLATRREKTRLAVRASTYNPVVLHLGIFINSDLRGFGHPRKHVRARYPEMQYVVSVFIIEWRVFPFISC